MFYVYLGYIFINYFYLRLDTFFCYLYRSTLTIDGILVADIYCVYTFLNARDRP